MAAFGLREPSSAPHRVAFEWAKYKESVKQSMLQHARGQRLALGLSSDKVAYEFGAE